MSAMPFYLVPQKMCIRDRVRRELDAVETKVQRFCHGTDQQRLRQARNSHQEGLSLIHISLPSSPHWEPIIMVFMIKMELEDLNEIPALWQDNLTELLSFPDQRDTNPNTPKITIRIEITVESTGRFINLSNFIFFSF